MSDRKFDVCNASYKLFVIRGQLHVVLHLLSERGIFLQNLSHQMSRIYCIRALTSQLFWSSLKSRRLVSKFLEHHTATQHDNPVGLLSQVAITCVQKISLFSMMTDQTLDIWEQELFFKSRTTLFASAISAEVGVACVKYSMLKS